MIGLEPTVVGTSALFAFAGDEVKGATHLLSTVVGAGLGELEEAEVTAKCFGVG
jgi:hypothetical protein